MKYIYTLLLIILSYQVNFACSAAYQYSLFPLGASMGQVVLLELELERYLKTPENQLMQFGGNRRFSDNKYDAETIEVRWKGSIKLYTYQGKKRVLFKDLGQVDLLDKEYTASLQPYFSEAMELAQAMPMFEEARLENMGICHYDRSCTFFDRIINKEQIKFYCKSNEKNYNLDSAEVIFPYKVLEKAEKKLKTKFTQFDSLETQLRIDFFRIWSPQNVRRYTIGTTSLQVYTLGKGIKSKYFKTKKEDWEKLNIKGVEFFIQGSDVVYHGQRFDFIQFL